jgi:hypothetical protein
MSHSTDLTVSRTDLTASHIGNTEQPPLREGEARLKVNAFSVTANNLTYAVFGDMMQYWNFFPAPEGQGRVPVWGFATVSESRMPGLAEGRRVYGYLPMSTAFTVQPSAVKPSGFNDTTEHRQPMSPFYNQYVFTDTDPLYTADTEALQMLFRPLFTTAFLIDDFLADNGDFGAKQIIFSSASAKTAWAAAGQIAARGVTVVGLTSRRNVAFTESLGCYARVVAYEDIETLDASIASAFVDIAGDADVRGRVHRHFNPSLKYSCAVGATHWQESAGGGELPGPKPEFFFAPGQIAKRIGDWGAQSFGEKVAAAWRHFLPIASRLTKVVERDGLDGAASAFAAFVDGSAKADEGTVIRLG